MKPPPFVKLVKNIWCLANDANITVEIERCGRLTWDQPFKRILRELQNRGLRGPVLDVGACIGDSTRWFLDAGYRTLAFEPQRDAFLCLTRNCREAECFNYPVGNGERVDLIQGEGGNMGARGVTAAGETGIPTLRLDDLEIENVSCIKIDVEGWEPNVLAGAVKTIARCRPVVVAEFNPGALTPKGFTCEDILKYLPGFAREEIFRYGQQNWDVMFTP